MNTKALAIMAVAIIVVAGCGLAFASIGKDDDGYKSKATGRLMVYGNADNNDYLDNDDVEFIRDIADGKTVWNKDKNPFADANSDGVVDATDVAYAENLVKGKDAEPTRIFYKNPNDVAVSVSFPYKGAKIAAVSSHGLMLASTLGIYDKIVAVDQKDATKGNQNLFPGVRGFTNIGSPDTDTPGAVENIYNEGVKLVMGNVWSSSFSSVLESRGIDYLDINLHGVRSNGSTPLDGVITAGVILGCTEKSESFAQFYDEIQDYIKEKTSSIGTKTFVMPYSTTNPNTTHIDTSNADGSGFGDVYTVSQLPLVDLFGHGKLVPHNAEVEINDKVGGMDPDYIILSYSFGDVTVEEGQKLFNEKVQYFKYTRAYKEGHIFGINYGTYGTYLGLGGLPLLAAYIWPDLVDEDYGWDMLQKCYDNWSAADLDVKISGGLICYKMENSA